MGHALKLHPDLHCAAVTRIEVAAARARPSTLVLDYEITGKIGDLRMPPMMAPVRSDGLWRHTCFEAFVRAAPGTAYHEFNFAPSTQWAAYGFDGYRSGMRIEGELVAPRFEMESSGKHYNLRVSLALDRLPSLPSDAIWRLGLSAVIEEMNGALSYWALAHPPGKADFHHSDCFAHELPAT